jgi:DNA gyrase/topoisomerase IV subunit B
MTEAETLAEPVLRKIAGQPAPSDPPAVLIDTSIPEFLKRPTDKDKAAADQIRQEQADAKARKAAGRKARKEAERKGETRRMPLTGKAALAAIRG